MSFTPGPTSRGTGDVRETCKALNAAYQGRGGGKPGFCQGSLAEGSFEQVKAFLLKSLT